MPASTGCHEARVRTYRSKPKIHALLRGNHVRQAPGVVSLELALAAPRRHRQDLDVPVAHDEPFGCMGVVRATAAA
jgi:hypothetical protein